MPDAFYTEDLAPSYVRVARQIHEMLSRMKLNERLMSERQLSLKLGVSRMTLRRSLDYFQRQGILVTRHGGGTTLARVVQPMVEARQTSRMVGLLAETIESPLISRILKGVEKKVSESGFHVALAHSYGDMKQQIAQMESLKRSGVRGLAVFPSSRYSVGDPELIAALQDLLNSGIYLVLVDRYIPGIPAPCVLSDNFFGSYLATKHLIESGCRRLGLLGFGPDIEGGQKVINSPHRDRRKGFIAALEEHGLGSEPVVEAELGTHDYEEASQLAVKKWIGQSNRRLPFDGLFCMQDNMAFHAYLALKAAGFSVPGDVALVGYDNFDRELYRAQGLHLTSIDQPAEEIGEKAAELLLSRIDGKEEGRKRHFLLKPTLVVRTSCGTGLKSAKRSKTKN